MRWFSKWIAVTPPYRDRAIVESHAGNVLGASAKRTFDAAVGPIRRLSLPALSARSRKQAAAFEMWFVCRCPKPIFIRGFSTDWCLVHQSSRASSVCEGRESLGSLSRQPHQFRNRWTVCRSSRRLKSIPLGVLSTSSFQLVSPPPSKLRCALLANAAVRSNSAVIHNLSFDP